MLFEWRQTGVDAKTGKVLGMLSPTGELPSFADEIEGKGLKLPPEMEMAASAR